SAPLDPVEDDVPSAPRDVPPPDVGDEEESTGESPPSPEPPTNDGLQFDFDCISIDRIQGPRIVPPAGIQVGFRVLDCNGDPIQSLASEDLHVINDEKGTPFGTGGEGGGVSDLGI